MVKNLPTVQETPVPSPGWEDPLEKGMATHCSTLVWRIPWTEEPGRYSPWVANTEQGSLCYRVDPYGLSILFIAVCIR